MEVWQEFKKSFLLRDLLSRVFMSPEGSGLLGDFLKSGRKVFFKTAIDEDAERRAAVANIVKKFDQAFNKVPISPNPPSPSPGAHP